jgi:multiple antibiotic resistance protein
MNYVEGTDYLHMAVVIVIFLVICLLTYLAFVFSSSLVKLIGKNKITVLGKLMGLILTVIGTTMAIEGIQLAFQLDQ